MPEQFTMPSHYIVLHIIVSDQISLHFDDMSGSTMETRGAILSSKQNKLDLYQSRSFSGVTIIKASTGILKLT